MSRKRETAGVSFFRISKQEPNESDSQSSEAIVPDEASSQPTSKPKSRESTKDQKRKSEAILKEIKADNKNLRNSNEVKEKVFDIDIGENLVKMRDDTKLVIVDIPGINEADTNNIYMKYVEKNWNNFDCMVVVMDASQGVNTTEQVDLLKFVKKNLKKKRDIPVIILGNKVCNLELKSSSISV
jgi:hypothetical protein